MPLLITHSFFSSNDNKKYFLNKIKIVKEFGNTFLNSEHNKIELFKIEMILLQFYTALGCIFQHTCQNEKSSGENNEETRNEHFESNSTEISQVKGMKNINTHSTSQMIDNQSGNLVADHSGQFDLVDLDSEENDIQSHSGQNHYQSEEQDEPMDLSIKSETFPSKIPRKNSAESDSTSLCSSSPNPIADVKRLGELSACSHSVQNVNLSKNMIGPSTGMEFSKFLRNLIVKNTVLLTSMPCKNQRRIQSVYQRLDEKSYLFENMPPEMFTDRSLPLYEFHKCRARDFHVLNFQNLFMSSKYLNKFINQNKSIYLYFNLCVARIVNKEELKAIQNSEKALTTILAEKPLSKYARGLISTESTAKNQQNTGKSKKRGCLKSRSNGKKQKCSYEADKSVVEDKIVDFQGPSSSNQSPTLFESQTNCDVNSQSCSLKKESSDWRVSFQEKYSRKCLYVSDSKEVEIKNLIAMIRDISGNKEQSEFLFSNFYHLVRSFKNMKEICRGLTTPYLSYDPLFKIGRFSQFEFSNQNTENWNLKSKNINDLKLICLKFNDGKQEIIPRCVKTNQKIFRLVSFKSFHSKQADGMVVRIHENDPNMVTAIKCIGMWPIFEERTFQSLKDDVLHLAYAIFELDE